MSIVRVDLFGYETKAKKVHLVGPEDEPNESNPSIDVQFELFPSDSTRSDYRFHWQNQPIRVIYSHVRRRWKRSSPLTLIFVKFRRCSIESSKTSKRM